MLNLNTKLWKTFCINQLFEVSLADGDIKEKECELGTIPLVSSGESNNGIVTYTNGVCAKPSTIISGNKITVDMFCNAYFQPDDFYCVSHGRVNILTPRYSLTTNHLLFICSLIKFEKYRFGYGRALYSNVIKELTIKLPITKNGTPDWDFMENYIKSLKIPKIETKNNLRKYKIDSTNWQYFLLKELFDIETGTDLIYQEQEEGEYPVVGHNESNHGITCYVKRLENRRLYDHKKTISLGDRGCFIAYVQPQDFYIGTRVKALISKFKEANIYNLQFVSTLINQEQFKFCYGRNATSKTPEITVKLPVKNTGEPDWDYMENYIKSLPYGDCI